LKRQGKYSLRKKAKVTTTNTRNPEIKVNKALSFRIKVFYFLKSGKPLLISDGVTDFPVQVIVCWGK